MAGFRSGALYAPPTIYSSTESPVQISPSQAHAANISLAKFVSVAPGDTLRHDTFGRWSVMVSALNSGDAPIQTATAECTFEDKKRDAIGNGTAIFNNVPVNQKIWQSASLKGDAAERPTYVECTVGVAYNLN